MTAIQIADSFDSFAIDHTPDGWPAVQQKQLTEAALMLRKQHEAIRVLRKALEDTAQTLVWMQWGDCRKFTQRKLLTVQEAVEKTQKALAETKKLI